MKKRPLLDGFGITSMATTKFFSTCLLPAAVMITLLMTACGGAKGSGGDSSSGGTPNAYLGVLSVVGGSDLGGTLLLTPPQGAASAAGTLVMTSGSVVPLSGTYSSNGFNVAGGGYAIVAAVGSGGLTGTGTTPGGQQATVSAPTAPPVSAPPPADPSGTYKGTFRIETIGEFKNTLPNGTVSLDCTFNAVITGTLTMEVHNNGSGQIRAHLTADSLDTYTNATCPGTWVNTVSMPGSGLDFQGPATSLQFGRVIVGQGGTTVKGPVTRAEAFSGPISGNLIVGTVWRSFYFTALNPNTGETHVESYPMSGTTVTLTRQ